MRVAVLTVSDRVSRGEAEDGSGDTLEQLLRDDGYEVLRALVPDERGEIAATLRALAGDADLVLTTGGTGPAIRDVTPEATRAVIERKSWPVPAIFSLIQKIGAVAQHDMDETFNNGLGMILIVGKKEADSVLRTLRGLSEQAYVIGEIRSGARAALLRD